MVIETLRDGTVRFNEGTGLLVIEVSASGAGVESLALELAHDRRNLMLTVQRWERWRAAMLVEKDPVVLRGMIEDCDLFYPPNV